ncbi:MAG TPA: hypothetical protein VGG37_06000, partial [Opitutaceae bacterium]
RGFLSGHLYTDLPVDPRVGSPNHEEQMAATACLDASYYKGHYYLYFGAVPAVFILLPYRWLVGGDLDPRYIVALASCAGLLFAYLTFRRAVRDFMPGLGAGLRALCVVVLAFGSAVPVLLTHSMMYEVAIGSGYACTMAGVYFLYRALLSKGAAGGALAAASACMGLAVGCRPNLVLNIPLLAVAAVLIARRRSAPGAFWKGLAASAIPALLPAAAIGAALAAYNYERFGSITEFGMHYQVNYFIRSDMKLFGAAYLWPNFHWMYLTLPTISVFFPYVLPEMASFGPLVYRTGESIHGEFIFTIFALWVAAALASAAVRRAVAPLWVFLGFLGWMFVAPSLPIMSIGFRGDRYLVDYQPALDLAGVLVGCAAATCAAFRSRRLWLPGFAALGALAAAFNFLAGIQEFGTLAAIRPGTYRRLEALGNYPAYWLSRAGLLHWGALELKVRFPETVKEAVVQPLVVAGTPEFTDGLYAILWPPGDRIAFQADHSGYGGPSTPPIEIKRGGTYTVSVDMGALHPPAAAPFYRGKDADRARGQKSWIRVRLDGAVELETPMNYYDAPPWTLQFGHNHVTMNPFRTDFDGQILSVKRTSFPPIIYYDGKQAHGSYRMDCAFPMNHVNGNFPIYAEGEGGNGTLVYATVLPGGKIRLGCDEWSIGGPTSAEIPMDGESHVLELFFGPLLAADGWPAEWGAEPKEYGRYARTLRLWIDGRAVFTAQLKRKPDPADVFVEFGMNTLGFSTAETNFGSGLRPRAYTQGEAREFVLRNFAIEP